MRACVRAAQDSAGSSQSAGLEEAAGSGPEFPVLVWNFHRGRGLREAGSEKSAVVQHVAVSHTLKLPLHSGHTPTVRDDGGRAAGHDPRLLPSMHRAFFAGRVRTRPACVPALRDAFPGQKRLRSQLSELVQERARAGLRLHRGVFVPVQSDCGPAGPKLGPGPHQPAGPTSAAAVPAAALHSRLYL